jgi:hypothetical protein
MSAIDEFSSSAMAHEPTVRLVESSHELHDEELGGGDEHLHENFDETHASADGGEPFDPPKKKKSLAQIGVALAVIVILAGGMTAYQAHHRRVLMAEQAASFTPVEPVAAPAPAPVVPAPAAVPSPDASVAPVGQGPAAAVPAVTADAQTPVVPVAATPAVAPAAVPSNPSTPADSLAVPSGVAVPATPTVAVPAQPVAVAAAPAVVTPVVPVSVADSTSAPVAGAGRIDLVDASGKTLKAGSPVEMQRLRTANASLQNQVSDLTAENDRLKRQIASVSTPVYSSTHGEPLPLRSSEFNSPEHAKKVSLTTKPTKSKGGDLNTPSDSIALAPGASSRKDFRFYGSRDSVAWIKSVASGDVINVQVGSSLPDGSTVKAIDVDNGRISTTAGDIN